MSSTIQRLPSESSWTPSYPPRPSAPETSSDGRRIPGRGRVGRLARVLGREQKPLRPGIPGHAVDRGDVVALVVLCREHGHAVPRIGVEVDARDVAGRAALVPLEEEVGAVVVVEVGALEPLLEDEVGVLVRLGLVRFHFPVALEPTMIGLAAGRRRCRSRSRRLPPTGSPPWSSPGRRRSAGAPATGPTRGEALRLRVRRRHTGEVGRGRRQRDRNHRACEYTDSTGNEHLPARQLHRSPCVARRPLRRDSARRYGRRSDGWVSGR